MLPPRPSQTPKYIDQAVQTVTPDCSFADQVSQQIHVQTS